MKTSLLFFFILTAQICFSQSDSTRVRDCFNRYKKAILNDDGAAAYDQVNEKTRRYYAEVLDMVRSYDSAELSKRSLIDRITVLSIRHRISKEELKQLDGKGVFIYAVNNGMVGKSSVMNNEVGSINQNGNFATGELVVRNKKTPVNFYFNRENENWKIDLTALFPLSNVAFQKLISESGKSETEFLFQILEALSGRTPDHSIWLPMND